MSETLPIGEIFSSIQGEGYLAGRRQIFIRMTGCNLDCRYCDTEYATVDSCRVEQAPGSNDFEIYRQPLTFIRLREILEAWTQALPGAHHSISITGGEPLLFAEDLAGWLPELRRILPIHLETNGTLASELEQIIDQVDYISMDMKLPSTAGCGEGLWDSHRLFLESAVAKDVSVKIVVGAGTGTAEILRVCAIIAAVRKKTPLFLQPLTLPDTGCGINAVHLLYLQALASAQLPDVRVIPQMHKLMGVL
ncbi:MAG: 7-carboxy-7-deazaguanine synthase QueE [Desulfuromonadales bacterium]|nr:7-carboxy-7-deazaguanine synthase QueE [Desulfuromonadales bacterium]